MSGNYPITREQVAFYQENGYIQLPGVLTPEELKGLRTVLARGVRDRERKLQNKLLTKTVRNVDYERVFVQMVNLWEEYEEMRPYILNLRLAEIARRLTRARSVRLWHDHALIKMPNDSKPTPWHQDLPYWPMKEPGALSCWLALDNVSEENGCLWFLPGSHKLGSLEPINLVTPQDIFKIAKVKKSKAQPAVMEMKAGSCTFHDGRTFHYAGPNLTNRPRRALAIIYIPNGVTYDGKNHICTDGLNLPIGSKFRHRHFPVLVRK